MLNSQMNNSHNLDNNPVNPYLHNKVSVGEAFECEMDGVIVLFETAVDSTTNLDL